MEGENEREREEREGERGEEKKLHNTNSSEYTAAEPVFTLSPALSLSLARSLSPPAVPSLSLRLSISILQRSPEWIRDGIYGMRRITNRFWGSVALFFRVEKLWIWLMCRCQVQMRGATPTQSPFPQPCLPPFAAPPLRLYCSPLSRFIQNYCLHLITEVAEDCFVLWLVCILSEKHVGFKRLQSSFVLIWGERRINKQIGRNLIRVNGDGLGFLASY